eukprot:CAMPEP_0179482138 /NCGR_PEP_ID=MMETSP0799-20121207/59719_1 /TAXON_ID=46947 /ORGANISM="Geminigera cryophila, Strain CCMP2564" /LENGTH=173 /DNA_ID=CAMNT_0021295151 /DNA_START=36 /DNA_END=554 /DNA_ORIENTATION=+
MIETTHNGHAAEIVHTAVLSQLDGIIAMGGDGILSEVMQGLLSRTDADASLVPSFPVGVIPSGTGNGFAASNLFAAGEKCAPLPAALVIVRSRLQRTDIGFVMQNNRVLYRCMLSWAWGLISDTDIEADDMRFVGPIRTTIKGIVNILRRRIYRGRIHLLLHSSDYMHGHPPM